MTREESLKWLGKCVISKTHGRCIVAAIDKVDDDLVLVTSTNSSYFFLIDTNRGYNDLEEDNNREQDISKAIDLLKRRAPHFIEHFIFADQIGSSLQTPSTIEDRDYPHICPICQQPAYISCITGKVDCSNPNCS